MFRQLFLENINFIQEENDRSLNKPTWVTDWVKQGKCFLHTILKKEKINLSVIFFLKEEENIHFTTVSSSISTWSYSEIATKKMMAVTFSKQWIHFLRSDLWPPTSNIRYVRSPITKVVSVIPVVFTRDLKTSWSVGI